MKNAPSSSDSSMLRRYVVVMLGVYAAWIALYYLTAWIGQMRGPAFDPAIPLDDSIPYVPGWLPVYYLAYIIIPGIFLISREPAFLNRAYLTIIAANAVSFLLFVLFPAMGPARDAVNPSASAVNWMVAATHILDSRFNALPSLHATNPWLLFLLAARQRGWSGITALFLVLALAISAATVLVKQHFILDVFAGMALAGLAFWGVGKMKISAEAW